MRSTTIIRGRFANGEGQKGNYTAYNTKNEQIFIHKNVMEGLGWATDKDVPKQFYALIDERDIQTRDENGDLTDVLVKRLSATAIFEEEEELINAFNSDARLAIKIKQDLKAIATSAGLTESAMSSFLEVAI